MNIVPLRNYVLALLVQEAKTGELVNAEGSPIAEIPEVRVIAKGPDVSDTIKVDGQIITGGYTGLLLETGGKKYSLFREQDIVAVIENNPVLF